MHLTRREFVAIAGAAVAARVKGFAHGVDSQKFTPDLASLQHYRAPDWFRDAKLGIWACWGPESVPEMGDWYARNLYIQGHPQYDDHLKRYGHPSKIGYKDLVPMWRAEAWDPDRLMRRYKQAGAKYFCAIAQHHDNFDCWNSKHHRWNAVRMGPKRDVIGTWSRTARAQGLRFGVTEHLGASWNWFGVSKTSDKTGVFAGVPYDGADPEYGDLYHVGNNNASVTSWYRGAPEAFQREWFRRIQDLVDSYHPDLLYSDGSLPFGRYGRELLAHFYNTNAQRSGGQLQAVYNCKFNDDGGQFIPGMCVQDLERGLQEEIKAEPWQTDTCVGDWYYKGGITYKTATTVIQMLVDIVSKNGNLLLNFPLRADGTLDAEEEGILAQMAEWIGINGEAIYNTRPWRIYGEGGQRIAGGKFNEDKLQYTSRDIRFTTRGSLLYGIALGWPDSGTLTIRSLAGANVQSVRLLRGYLPLSLKNSSEGLVITVPRERPGDHAFVFRIEGAV
jgi:alpha-L-fucosidase